MLRVPARLFRLGPRTQPVSRAQFASSARTFSAIFSQNTSSWNRCVCLTGLAGGLVFAHLLRQPAQSNAQLQQQLGNESFDLSPEDLSVPLSLKTTEPIVSVAMPPDLRNIFEEILFGAKIILRGITLTVVWLPVLVSYFWIKEESWRRYLLWSLELSGPTFIKLGQWASTRPDLFPPELCLTLSQLQSNVEAHSLQYSRRLLRSALGADIADRITLKRVLGSGCIAQVYEAVLHGGVTGQEQDRDVAIKILHPGVSEKVIVDLHLMSVGARFLDFVVPGLSWLSFPESAEVFSNMMRVQLNLCVEAVNFDIFSKNFQNKPHVRFPRPVWPLVHPEVLVESYEKARPLHHYLQSQRLKGSPLNKRLARVGMDMFLKMMIEDNFVHSDLHPGNILVEEHVTSPSDFGLPSAVAFSSNDSNANRGSGGDEALVVLDAGLVTALSPRDRRNFIALFGALLEGNGSLAADLMVENSRNHQILDLEAFRRDLHELVSQIPAISLGQLEIGPLLNRVFYLARTHRVKLESNYTTLIMSVGVLEGVGRQLNPNLSLVTESIPVLLSHPESRRVLLESGGWRLVSSLKQKIGLA